MNIFPELIFGLIAAMFLAAGFAYSWRMGRDFRSSYNRVLLFAGKWFGFVSAVLGGLIEVLAGFIVFGHAADRLGGGVSPSPWFLVAVLVALGAAAIAIGIAIWRFLSACLRHDTSVGRI